MQKCEICGKQLTGKQQRFCSVKCKNVFHQGYPGQRERGLKRKLALVQKHGSKCALCGYDKNLAALTFHHMGDKKIKMDMRSMSNHKRDVIMNEFEKCILLCANCHLELHNPHLVLPINF